MAAIPKAAIAYLILSTLFVAMVQGDQVEDNEVVTVDDLTSSGLFDQIGDVLDTIGDGIATLTGWLTWKVSDDTPVWVRVVFTIPNVIAGIYLLSLIRGGS